MHAASPLIEADDLRRAFKNNEAVAGISFSVQRGEIFGLLGPNGAGKTTTIRMLTGQIDPSGGRATVAGCDVVKDRALLKQRIGVVFEEQNLYERLSARDNLRFNCWLYNLPEHRIDEVLDLVQLREHVKAPVRTFSNGMKQRLMIARALLHKPPVLFLDEPTRGPDPKDTSRLTETALSMDDPQDQARLAELMAQGNVRSIHSQEATLEEVFIEVAGIRPA